VADFVTGPTVTRRAAATAAPTVESRASWAVALTALGIYAVSFGAPTITVVALKPIAAELGSARSVPALAFALAWLGSAVGGIMMGWLAERIGIRWVVIGGALMIAIGLVLSSLGGTAGSLYIGHGVFMGVLGNAGINAPLYVYVSRWFDRRET
jgi:MFS family permease